MSALLWKQFVILIWKSCIIRRRHWLSAIFELLTPIALSLAIAYLYYKGQTLAQENSKPIANDKTTLKPTEQDVEASHSAENRWVDPTYYDKPTIKEKFDSYTAYLKIFYCPDNDVAKALTGQLSAFGLKVKGFESETELKNKLEAMLTDDKEKDGFRWNFGLILDTDGISKGRLNYTIRQFGRMAEDVHRLFPEKYKPGPIEMKEIQIYTYFGELQILVNQAFVNLKLNNTSNGTADNTTSILNIKEVETYLYPYPKYKKISTNEDIKFSMQEVVAGIIVIGYVVLCPLIVKRITDEKAAKAKEMLRMIGMSDWVFWSSHFVSFFIVMVFHCIVFVLIYCIGFGGYPIIEYSNSLLFFLILIIYSIQTILFCMTITTVFNQPVIAVIVTVILWMLTYAVPLGIWNPQFHRNMNIIGTNKARLFTSILPNMGLAWCMAVVGQYEVMGTGAKMSSIYHGTALYGWLTLGLIMLVMVASCFLYILLIWYIDSVWPFQFGVPKPVYFPFLPSYWCPGRYKRNDNNNKDSKSDLVIDTRNFEREPDTKVTIAIKNLCKVFSSFGGVGRKVAVDDVTLNIYDKQITALLGHNGAGKSTTMNMITGIFPPTSGSVSVSGYDVVSETSNARRSIGLCPQENIIFSELTVYQHLKLYAILKGFSWSAVNAEVKHTLEMLKLMDKMHIMAENLSGGMKRKLMLGIAVIGGTQTLILDEPTSGMDPEARRVIWDLLQQLRKDRTILLTTHYMEEADVLGDRIAIVCEGRIKCCGSPMFLKKRFGAGYHLRVCKSNGFNESQTTQLIQKYMPNCEIHSDIQSEIVYSLESNNERSKQSKQQVFPQLFNDIEQNKERLAIASFGLTITTMEDVFIRVGNEFDDNIDSTIKNGHKESDKLLAKREKNEHLTGFQLFSSSFVGLLVKRFHYARRYLPMIFFQLVLPAILFMIALGIDYAIRNSIKAESKNLELKINDMYGSTKGFYKNQDNVDKHFGEIYRNNAHKYDVDIDELQKEDINMWALDHSSDLEEYTHRYLTGLSISKDKANIWYNKEATHSLPLAINLYYEALIKYLFPDKSDSMSISLHNYPVVGNEATFNLMSFIFGWVVTALLLTPITVPFLAASYVLFPINERISKAKLLQLMTGLSPLLYWFSNFIFDLLMHTAVVIIIYFVFGMFDFNLIFFGQSSTAIGLFLMLFLFGVASIPLAYCFSLIMSKASTGFAILVILYLIFGIISTLILSVIDFLMHLMNLDIMSDFWFNFILFFLRLVPVFSMSFGIQKLYRVGSLFIVCQDLEKVSKMNLSSICMVMTNTTLLKGCCPNLCQATNECYYNNNPLSFTNQGVGHEFVFLIATGILFMALLFIFEADFIRKLLYMLFDRLQSFRSSGNGTVVSANGRQSANEDSDVVAEKYRIEGLNDQRKLSTEALAVMNLSKSFGSFRAVNGLTFGVHKEECFGLLGVNGAGKTTTFSMLTGDLMVTTGNAFLDNLSLRNNIKSFQQNIGYCPQFDALLDKLTGCEMLYLFARLRGVPQNAIQTEVENLIKMVDLQNHAKRRTETYSGGNRRKLSLAIAIVGNPPVIFLDEPTAGVDPTARRKIWSTLVYIQEKFQSAIVLTSHSMEECEALCARIAIMVNGQFKCLGPVQHLRKKFGQGFTIIIKLIRELNDNPKYVASVQQHIKNAFPSAVLKDSHQCLLHYHIPDTSVQWSHLFSVMEETKQNLKLEDYLVSDTTLEQIFLAFAKTQQQQQQT